MNRKINLLVLVALVTLFASSCLADPRKQAQATQIEEQANQDALNQDVTRTHTKELNALETQNKTLDYEHRVAIADQLNLTYNRVIRFGGMAFVVLVVVVLFATAWASIKTINGVGRAIVQAAELRANLIYLDPRTRQFPLVRDGHYIGNPNVHGVLGMNATQTPDRQAIATSGMVQYVGALAQEAKQSNDPAGMAIINAPVVDVKDQLISIGRELVRRNE